MKKCLSLILSIVLLSLASCSDNDDTVWLSYKETKIANFKMYVGSENGGVEVNTANIDPKRYFRYELNSIDERLKDASCSFSGNKITDNFGDLYSSAKYKITDNKIYILEQNKYGETYWAFYAFGHPDGFKRLTHYGYQYQTKENVYTLTFLHFDYYEELETININDAIEVSYDFDSLDEMTSITDTIVFCTIESYFR
ncbi:hypothetical protein D0T53_00985 [Dysgonomonas sp. 216]|uniref:hypothetical protein n=1 Tax=Dysgonomonas sp. 216 TaxID=2302934 RepID=UPI0013D57610|nr:hypothetical protein [Dysgonomonas sp. 216]NDW17487.1 hypothetical protein [Dysgonomonas sp. 216]